MLRSVFAPIHNCSSGHGPYGSDAVMKRIKPLTFVLGIAPFTAASFKATLGSDLPAPVEPAQSALSPTTLFPPPDFLNALVRLLARQAAQEAFATRCTSTPEKETNR